MIYDRMTEVAGVTVANPLSANGWVQSLCEYKKELDMKDEATPRWKEEEIPVVTNLPGISSIRIRQHAEPTGKYVRQRRGKSLRRELRTEHVNNRIPPHMRWAMEENDSNEEQADEHMEHQRLLRKQLKRKRRKKRMERWSRQRDELIGLAHQVQRQRLLQSKSLPIMADVVDEEQLSTVELKQLWEDRGKKALYAGTQRDERARAPDAVMASSASPVAEIRRNARREIQQRDRQHLKKSPAKAPSSLYRRRKMKHHEKPLNRRPKNIELSRDQKERKLLRRQRLKETYAAFRAMTEAVVKAHGLMALQHFEDNTSEKRRGRQRKKRREEAGRRPPQSHYKAARAMNPALLADLERQQARLQVDLKRLSSKIKEDEKEERIALEREYAVGAEEDDDVFYGLGHEHHILRKVG